MEHSGRGCLVQAEVLRLKKDLKGEQNALEISHGLPFVEYEIHRQLINKMKVGQVVMIIYDHSITLVVKILVSIKL